MAEALERAGAAETQDDADTTVWIAHDLSVRRSLIDADTLLLTWGEGSDREDFETSSESLAAALLFAPRSATLDEYACRLAASAGLEAEEAASLVTDLRRHGLFSDSQPPRSPAEKMWETLSWTDALLFHRATRNTRWRHDYPPAPEVMTWFHEDKPVLPTEPRPSVSDEPTAGSIVLPPPSRELADSDMLTTLQRRRTHRDFRDTRMTAEALSEVLHWTFQPIIQGETRRYYTTQSSADGFREKVTPRPLSVYVLTGLGESKTRSDGITRGVYRYSPARHALDPCAAAAIPEALSELMWGQDFGDHAPAVAVLSINWRQYMWKYRMPYAYRMAHYDLGAFMQTLLIAATGMNMKTFITPAIDDERMQELLGTDPREESPSYVAALGLPASSD